ncbi:MAG: acyl-CoA thioesterase [Lentisphaeria bacterium]|jgi:acyl-CoA hydrolase
MSICNLFLVRSAHLNASGSLFGGCLMAQIDEVGYCLVRRLHPRLNFVTRACTVEFIAPARLGDLVEFTASLAKTGTSSLQVQVTGSVDGRTIATASLVYVRVRPDGAKAPIAEA